MFTLPPKMTSSIFTFIKSNMDNLEAILQESIDLSAPEYAFPDIIIIGDEKNGKSSLMENITKHKIFPQAREYCTKRPVRFTLLRGPSIGYTVSGIDEKEFSSTDENEIYSYILKYFQDSGDYSFSFEEIVITFTSPDNYNFSFVDLPGIKSFPEELALATRSITSFYLENKNNIILFAYSALTTSFANCATFGLLRASRREQDTVLVMTMLDKCSPQDANYNRSLRFPGIKTVFHVCSTPQESGDSTGLDNLLQHARGVLQAHVDRNWHKNIITSLETQVDALANTRYQLAPLVEEDKLAYKCILNMVFEKMNRFPNIRNYCTLTESTANGCVGASTATFKNGKFTITKDESPRPIEDFKDFEEIKKDLVVDWVTRVVSEFKANVGNFISGSLCNLGRIGNQHFCTADVGLKRSKCNILRLLRINCCNIGGRLRVASNDYSVYSEALDAFCTEMYNNLIAAATMIVNTNQARHLYETIAIKINNCLDYNQDLEFWKKLEYNFDDDSLTVLNDAIMSQQADLTNQIGILESRKLKLRQTTIPVIPRAAAAVVTQTFDVFDLLFTIPDETQVPQSVAPPNTVLGVAPQSAAPPNAVLGVVPQSVAPPVIPRRPIAPLPAKPSGL